MKPELGKFVTGLFMATLALRPRVIIAAACIVLAWATSHNIRAEERVIRIAVLGDTIVDGKGVPAGSRFEDKLEFALRARGQSVAVANASVVADTAARGLAKLDRVISDDTDAVILELGGADMFFGTDPNVTRAALAAILRNLEARRVVVLLCGARTNLDDERRKAFAAMFSGLASEYNVIFYPAFDDAFVDDAQLKALDGSHPNSAGIEAVVTRYCHKSRP